MSQEISKRLVDIEEYIRESREYIIEGKRLRDKINETMETLHIRLEKLEIKIGGDIDAKDKKEKDGLERRLGACEEKDGQIKDIQDAALKVSVGALTMAIGAFVIWLWKCVWAGIHIFKS